MIKTYESWLGLFKSVYEKVRHKTYTGTQRKCDSSLIQNPYNFESMNKFLLKLSKEK